MVEPREMQSRDARKDSPARFLRELRQLRSHVGLDLAELAARAHYPYDVIKAAEAGPSLPALPVLAAYVRGCGGTPADWEERWRAVTDSPASPLLPTRSTGWSEAADAGARVGAASAAPDGHDPDRVMAALNRVAGGMAAAASSSSASGPAASSKPPSGKPPSGGPVSDAPSGDPAAPGDWGFAPTAGKERRESAAAPAWDSAPASLWDPAPKMPSARDSAGLADPVWDPAPAVDPRWDSTPAVHPVWDPAPAPEPARDLATPATSSRNPRPPARQAHYPATAPVRRDSAKPAPAPIAADPAAVPSGSGRRRMPSWRVFAAILTVVLIVVATMLAFST